MAQKNETPNSHGDLPGGYFIMIDSEQTVGHEKTLAEARRVGQSQCDKEVLPCSFSIQDENGNHIEDIKRSDCQSLSQQIASFNAKHRP